MISFLPLLLMAALFQEAPTEGVTHSRASFETMLKRARHRFGEVAHNMLHPLAAVGFAPHHPQQQPPQQILPAAAAAATPPPPVLPGGGQIVPLVQQSRKMFDAHTYVHYM